MKTSMQTRRNFLKIVGIGTSALFISGCDELSMLDTSAPFSIIVLPDTQYYADTVSGYAQKKWGNGDLRQYFFDQTQWIKNSKEKLNVAMVLHLGDIVNTDCEADWEIADKAFRTLDGKVPYLLSLGNHDMQSGERRNSLFCKYFPRSRFEDYSWYGGHYGDAYGGDWNYYTLFESGGMKFIALSLEFKPRDEVLSWANEVIAAHPEHRFIIITHSYLRNDASYNDESNYPHTGNSARKVWDKLIQRHENIFMVLCGHVLGSAIRTDSGEKGNEVHQILADFQGMNNGGEGYLRIMTFHPAEDRIEIQTYSPSLDTYLTTPENQFSIKYSMPG